MSTAAIEALVILAAKWGPQLVLDIEKVFTKSDPTIQEFADLFRDLKPYDAFGIPDIAPTKPTV